MTARIQVWGKGYRVTGDTEEFQRYVPARLGEESPLEGRLRATNWGGILEPLYEVADQELSAQRCVLFDAGELLAVAFGRTSDRHGRPSLVVVGACAAIRWDDGLLGDMTSRAVSLAARLALEYAEIFRGNPEGVGTQLRTGAFLPSRAFDLVQEMSDASVEWPIVLSGVREWRGITGVATSRLLGLGANIVLGTRYEAEKARPALKVDGYYDVREKEIRALSDRLGKWGKAEAPTPTSVVVEDKQAAIVDSLARIEERLERLVRLTERLVDQGGQKKKKGMW